MLNGKEMFLGEELLLHSLCLSSKIMFLPTASF